MLEIDNTMIAAIGTAGGVIITAAAAILKNKWDASREAKKGDNADHRSETEQALGMYKGLIDSLKSDIKEMMGYLHELEKEHATCREENIKLNIELKMLNERVAQLEGKTNGNVGVR